MGPSALVKTAHNSQNSKLLRSTVRLNIHPVTHPVSASGCPSVLAAENFVFNIHLGVSIRSHLQKLSAETLITTSLQPPPPRLLAGTCHLPQDSGWPHLWSANMLPEVIDWKCSLKLIQMVHLHIHIHPPTAVSAIASSICKHCFLFFRTWPWSWKPLCPCLF